MKKTFKTFVENIEDSKIEVNSYGKNTFVGEVLKNGTSIFKTEPQETFEMAEREAQDALKTISYSEAIVTKGEFDTQNYEEKNVNCDCGYTFSIDTTSTCPNCGKQIVDNIKNPRINQDGGNLKIIDNVQIMNKYTVKESKINEYYDNEEIPQEEVPYYKVLNQFIGQNSSGEISRAIIKLNPNERNEQNIKNIISSHWGPNITQEMLDGLKKANLIKESKIVKEDKDYTEALQEVKDLIAKGWDFAEAVFKVSDKYKLDYKQLEDMYDNE